jgi:membrane protein CcdC involved in cytochrome C biogenesis
MILVLRLSFSKFYRPWQFNGIYLLVETASRDNSFKSTVHRSTSLSPAGTSTRYWMLITCIICPWRNTMKQTKKWNNIPKHLDPMTK